MDLKNDFMYRLEQDQELQRVSALPVTCHACAGLLMFQEVEHPIQRLDFSSNMPQVFRSTGWVWGYVGQIIVYIFSLGSFSFV